MRELVVVVVSFSFFAGPLGCADSDDGAVDTQATTTAPDTSSTDATSIDATDATDDDATAVDTTDDDTDADSTADDATSATDGETIADGDAPDGGACSGAFEPAPGRYLTDRGAVEGTVEGGVAQLLGIPFAAPPVGALRWRPPAEVACWEGVRPATEWSVPCLQKDFQQGQDTAEIVGQEDCLYLNVWAPTAAAAPRPVLVFIHGGGNVSGATSAEVFNQPFTAGQDLAARRDVVVVTIEYRLGPLGFLALPELSARDPRGVSGNYGLLDQIAALGWVARNIAAFGGDPERVMVFGESAGAVDTLALVASPLAAGLFHRALMQSGGVLAKPLALREREGEDFVEAVGCDGASDPIACLGGLTPDVLLGPVTSPFSGGIAGGGGFGPTIDGWVLAESPLDALTGGRHNHVPFVVGANADETSVSVPAGTITPSKVETALEAFGEPYTSQLLALYPPGATNEEARTSWVRLTTDAQFVCGARRIARAADLGQDEPVWRYFFTHTGPGAAGGQNGAFHGLELFYVFGAVERIFGGAVARPEDKAVVSALMGYWTRFAAQGDPNGEGATAWPEYVGADDPYLEIAAPLATGEGVRSAACDVWDAIAAAATP